ncbi:inhibitor of nuclear factor kappa-B kinase subunit alpha-like isoform X2 [Lineus longissimus]|uniref:inhibitor of nuclear factor kappa-B kinase subunit alpha-like isoform X2 n=1 Tax=Lineus longissimus TaxID=88925 RepID=UPI00315C8BF7
MVEEVAHWRKIEELGSGGFGCVILIKDEKNNRSLALKKVKSSLGEIDTEKKARWISEVSIMKKLEHVNVVTAYEMPPGIDHLVGDMTLPVLCMEYCSGGSLRKVLGQPENSIGLSEFSVRNITRDIASAIEYLHSKRIIHRDIKPDNIVLKPTEDKIIYKLIDLGYAKELNEKNLLYSLAGTKYYLAPELLTTQRQYTGTVDFWSFGITVFEIITGQRPFLASFADDLYNWHNFVSRKQDTHIFIEQNGDRVVYSTRLPKPNNLCRPFAAYMEDFLRSVLKFEPQNRGGGMTPTCFDFLREKLEQKIIHIFSVPTNELLSYPVNDKVTILDLKKNSLEKESKVPVEEQELLLPTGQTPENIKPAANYLAEPGTEEDAMVFMFSRREGPLDVKRKQRSFTDLVINMLNNPKNLYAYPDQKKIWGQAVHYCLGLAKDYNRLLHAQKAAMLSLLRENMVFTKYANKMELAKNRLAAKLEFFKFSQEYDMEKYHAQFKEESSLRITSDNMIRAWEKMMEKANGLEDVVKTCQEHEDQCNALRTKIVELQRSPFARTKPTDTVDDLAAAVQGLYGQLIGGKTKEERRKMTDRNEEMSESVVRCLEQYEKLTQDLYRHIDKVFKYKCEVMVMLRKLEIDCNSVEEGVEQLMKSQRQRQDSMWKMVKIALQKGDLLTSMTSSQMTMSRMSEMMASLQLESLQTHELESSLYVETFMNESTLKS